MINKMPGADAHALGDLTLEFYAAELHMRPTRYAYVRRQGLARTLVETERVVQKEFREAARGKPREAAVISQAPEGEAPIAIQAVPAEKGRLRHGTSHRLDRIPHQFANMPEFMYHTVTKRHVW